MSAVVSLSSSEFSSDCKEVMTLMRRLHIAGDVTHNRTLTETNQEERGCRIVLSDFSRQNAERFWRHARRLPGVRCAHVTLEHHERGCSYDIFAPSLCPHVPGAAPTTDSLE